MWPNPQFPADLVTLTEEIHHGKLHFLCSDSSILSNLTWLNEGRDLIMFLMSFTRISRIVLKNCQRRKKCKVVSALMFLFSRSYFTETVLLKIYNYLYWDQVCSILLWRLVKKKFWKTRSWKKELNIFGCLANGWNKAVNIFRKSVLKSLVVK